MQWTSLDGFFGVLAGSCAVPLRKLALAGSVNLHLVPLLDLPLDLPLLDMSLGAG